MAKENCIPRIFLLFTHKSCI